MGIYRISFIGNEKSTVFLFTYFQLWYLVDLFFRFFVNNVSDHGLLTLSTR